MKDHRPTQLEIMALFASQPKLIIEALSIYYPFTPMALLKYADILHWGERNSFDYDDGPVTKTNTFWSPGIIFNKAILWDDITRTIVASNLAIRGAELGLISYQWDSHDKDGHHSKNGLMNSCKHTIDIVASCPLPTFDIHQDGGLYSVEPLFGENDKFSDEKLSWSDLKARVEEDSIQDLIQHPDIWDKTLISLFTDEVVEELLNTFYWQHLNQRRSEFYTWDTREFI
jgi:hypothetical protein